MRRKRLDFILFVLIIIYDPMTCGVNVGTHHPLQQFPPSIMRDRPSETEADRNAIIHPSLLSSNILTKSNHLNLISRHLNSTIHPNDVIPIGNASGMNENANKYIGASNSNSNNSQVVLKTKRPFILNKRRRRDVLLLYNVVSCGTGCNPMRLMGYGCYCGFMGAGIPVDGIDKCCQVHDWCYENVPCPAFMLYFLRYNWQCVNGTPQCYPQANNCAYRMCQCDRMFAECLKQQPCPNKKVFCRSAPWRLIQNLIFDVGIAG